jgi:hypothetical protein
MYAHFINSVDQIVQQGDLRIGTLTKNLHLISEEGLFYYNNFRTTMLYIVALPKYIELPLFGEFQASGSRV